jgi:hypothetical protein
MGRYPRKTTKLLAPPTATRTGPRARATRNTPRRNAARDPGVTRWRDVQVPCAHGPYVAAVGRQAGRLAGGRIDAVDVLLLSTGGGR